MYSTVSVAACGVNLMKPMFSISKGVTFSTVTGGACRWTLVLADTTRQARIRRSRSASSTSGRGDVSPPSGRTTADGQPVCLKWDGHT